MNDYKLMIVDDDKLVRERLSGAIPFGRLGIRLCGEAENGIQALELYSRYHPQIIIMDINIPLLDGIETAKQILREDEETNIVIVTGHGTVDSAREAIRSGMVDFMLKPINEEELAEVLQKIVDKLNTQRKQALERQRLERLLTRGIPLIQNKYFLSMMQTPQKDISEREYIQSLRDLQIPGDVEEVCVCILLPIYDGMSVEMQMSSHAILEEEISRPLGTRGIGTVFLNDSMQRTLLVAYSPKKNLSHLLLQQLSSLRDKMRYIYKLDFRASIGTPVDSFRSLRDSYQSAEWALRYWSVAADNNIVCSEGVKDLNMPVAEASGFRYADLMTLLSEKTDKALCSELNSYMKKLAYAPNNTLHLIQIRSIELLSLLFLCAREQGGQTDRILNENPPVYFRVFQTDNAHDLSALVLEYGKRAFDSVKNQQIDNQSRVLSSAKQYILQNYADPELSLGKVAEYVHLSEGYVSYLFKQTDDQAFTKYLNHIRVEQAKKLLSTTHMRVYEVAEAVGYQTPKYFFQMFKQFTGLTPKEFYEQAAKPQG